MSLIRKTLDLEYVVLCPTGNLSELKGTVLSIKNRSYDRSILAIVGQCTDPDKLKQCNEICPTIVARDTITSLANEGIKNCTRKWAFVLFSGSRIKPSVERKLNLFTKTPRDVLFPVQEGKCEFVDGSFNGVLFNKTFFTAVGDFPEFVIDKDDTNDFNTSKLYWAFDALGKGAQFKAIVGLEVH